MIVRIDKFVERIAIYLKLIYFFFLFIKRKNMMRIYYIKKFITKVYITQQQYKK